MKTTGARNLPTPNCAFLVASLVDSGGIVHLHRLVSREAAHDQTWCRCEWLVDAGNFHELSPQKIDRFLSFDQESTLPLFFVHFDGTHTHTRCKFAPPLPLCDGCVQLLCKKRSSLTCECFSDHISDFWALTWAKLRSKIYSSFKMISGPMLSTKYMPTCRKIHNHRKIPLKGSE